MITRICIIGDDATATTSSARCQSGTCPTDKICTGCKFYIRFDDIAFKEEDPDFFKMQDYSPGHIDKRLEQEAIYRTIISNIFNVYMASKKRKALFSKSGFVGRVAKRRKG